MLTAAHTQTLVMQIAQQFGWGVLSLAASKASSKHVIEAMHRLKLSYTFDCHIPCCTPASQIPQLPSKICIVQKYNWDRNEANSMEARKGLTWLRTHICPEGVLVVAIQNQEWLDADFKEEALKVSGSKTDYLFLVDNRETQALATKEGAATAADLRKLLCYVLGAYEAKTTTSVVEKGILAIWPQATLECLALNHMAQRRNEAYFIPVFGGDFNCHLVVHAQPQDSDDFMLHIAHMKREDKENKTMAVRYMRHLLTQTLLAANDDEGGERLDLVSHQ